jgi:ubiquitin-protein ligase E3 A
MSKNSKKDQPGGQPAAQFEQVFHSVFEANLARGLSRQMAAVEALRVANEQVNGPATTAAAPPTTAAPSTEAALPTPPTLQQVGNTDEEDFPSLTQIDPALPVTPGAAVAADGASESTLEGNNDNGTGVAEEEMVQEDVAPSVSGTTGGTVVEPEVNPAAQSDSTMDVDTGGDGGGDESDDDVPLPRNLVWTNRGLQDVDSGRHLTRSEWRDWASPDVPAEPTTPEELLTFLAATDEHDTSGVDKVESIFCKELSVQSHFIPAAIKPVSVSAAMQYEEGWDVSAHVDLDSVTAMYQAVKAGYASHASDKEKGSKVLVAALEILADAVNFTADHVSCGKDLKPLVVVLENPYMDDPCYHIVLKQTLTAVDKLSTPARSALCTWLGNLDRARFMRYLVMLRQYTTIRMFMGVVEDARPAVRLLELFHNNMGRFDGLSLEEDFYNDEIKEYMSQIQGKRNEYLLWRDDVDARRKVEKMVEASRSPTSSRTSSRTSSPQQVEDAEKKEGETESNGATSIDQEGGTDEASGEMTVTPAPNPSPSSAPAPDPDPASSSRTNKTARIEAKLPALKYKSFISFPFVLTTAMKQEILLIDSRQKQDRLQRQIYYGQMGRATAYDVYLILHIRRDAILEDTLNQLVGVASDDFKKPLKIKFDGEEGIDAGGVRKEYFALMMKMLLTPDYGMFTYEGDVRLLWFSKDSFESNQEFELVGKLVGLALYNTVTLDLKLPQFVYRQLKGGAVSIKDLKELHPDLAIGLQQLLDFKPSTQVKDAFGLTFEITHKNTFGEMVAHELIPGGAAIEVDEHNRQQYVDAYVKWLLEDSVKTQFQAFRRGFLYVCGGEALDLFYPTELELLLCGNPVLNFDDLKKGTEYEDGYNAEDQIIQDFWVVLTDFNEDKKKAFLKFVSGNDRAPIDGLITMGFKISKNGDDDARLPTAHTCFNHLLLPQYSNIDVLRSKLITAMDEGGEGFGLQ